MGKVPPGPSRAESRIPCAAASGYFLTGHASDPEASVEDEEQQDIARGDTGDEDPPLKEAMDDEDPPLKEATDKEGPPSEEA